MGPANRQTSRTSISHARAQKQRPLPRHLVTRVLHDAQVRNDVFHVRLFEELRPAADLEGQPAAREFRLQFHRVVMRAVEHRYLAPLVALPYALLDGVPDEARLLYLIIGECDPGQFTLPLLREERLALASLVVGDEIVRGVEDVVRRAVVLL